jgi:hypothetical protein
MKQNKDFEKKLKEYYEEQRVNGVPYIRQLQLGLFEIFDGENTIVTSSGGYAQFHDAFRKAVAEEIKKIKSGIRENIKRFD